MRFRWERWVLGVVIVLGLSLVFVTVLQSKFDIVDVAAAASPKFIATATLAPFDPAYYGLPEVIAGYKILAVETSGNLACMQPDTFQVILQTSQPDLESFLKNAPGSGVEEELKKLNIKQPKQWSFQYVGPGISKESVIYIAKTWDPRVMTTCIKLGPMPTFEPTVDLGMNSEK